MKVFFFFFLCFFTCQWVLLYLEFCLVYNIDIVFLKVLIKISKWRFYFIFLFFFTISVTDIKDWFHLHMSLMAIVKDWGRGLRGLRGGAPEGPCFSCDNSYIRPVFYAFIYSRRYIYFSFIGGEIPPKPPRFTQILLYILACFKCVLSKYKKYIKEINLGKY